MTSVGVWRLRTRRIELGRPVIMGIVNTTPDSFSDGGRYLDVGAAIDHGRRLIDRGADIVDVGGESTRPGAESVDADEEIRRVAPVVESLAAGGVVVSIDTSKPEVASVAIDAGAEIVNDVSGLSDPRMRSLAAERRVGVVVMHMRGTPRTMQQDPVYDDVVEDVARFLSDRMRVAEEAGCHPESLVVDPGIGFGKTMEHNLTLCNRLSQLGDLGRPILIGTSRKTFLGSLTGVEEPADRDLATAVSMALAVERGASILRVHEPAATREAVAVALAIVRERRPDFHGAFEHRPNRHHDTHQS